MSAHAPFIVAAYAAALVGLGGLVISSLLTRRRVRREIAERGLEEEAVSPKRKRLWLLLGSMAVLGVAATLVLGALDDNIVFFYSPSQLAEKKPSPDRHFRLGGLVEQGSVQKSGQEVRFKVTDLQREVSVVYRGLLPDLFREGQGVIAEGTLGADGVFQAREVLAKHDENYMPPEVARALKESGRWKEGAK